MDGPSTFQFLAANGDAALRAARWAWALGAVVAALVFALLLMVSVRRSFTRRRSLAESERARGGTLDPWDEAGRRLDTPPPGFTGPADPDDDTVDIDPNDPGPGPGRKPGKGPRGRRR